MALNCNKCGGIIPDISTGGVLSACVNHIKPEINIGKPTILASSTEEVSEQ